MPGISVVQLFLLLGGLLLDTAQGFTSCPPGWTLKPTGQCLLAAVKEGGINWIDAESDCVARGGHLAAATTAAEWAELNATCASTMQQNCWVGGRQNRVQATPSAGWYWQDCTAQQASPWKAGQSGSFMIWRAAPANNLIDQEPNDFHYFGPSNFSYGVEHDYEDCALLTYDNYGQQLALFDFSCDSLGTLSLPQANGPPPTGTAYVCAKALGCSINATSTGGSLLPCTCTCLPPTFGNGTICLPCSPYATNTTVPGTNATACQCQSGFTGDGYTCNPANGTLGPTRTSVPTPTSYPGCAPSAVLVQETGGTQRCVCPAGYQGDGRVVCISCGLHATVLNGSTVCTCMAGYRGDGQICSPDVKKAGLSAAAEAAIAAVCIGVVAVGLIALCLYCRNRSETNAVTSGWMAGLCAKKGVEVEIPGSTVDVDLRTRGLLRLTLAQMQAATGNFSAKNKIGEGSFGPVYLGHLPDNSLAAIKRSRAASAERVREFAMEVELLSRLHHQNLVGLIGYCSEGKEHMLAYEYVGGGTLRERLALKNPKLLPLTWLQRLEIACGAAQGVAYLHHGASPPVLHRDLKSANILLAYPPPTIASRHPNRIIAKVADFGLSRPLHDGLDGPTNSYSVKGTPGYVDPECFETQSLTEKSDAYSFGIILLELITGLPAIVFKPEGEAKSLVRKIMPILTTSPRPDPSYYLDRTLEGQPSQGSLDVVIGLALRCLERHGRDRPGFLDIVRELASGQQMEASKPNAPPASSMDSSDERDPLKGDSAV